MRIFSIVFVFVPLSFFAQDSALVIPLWSAGAPGFENRKNEKEEAKDWWVKNIHNPSLTVFLPSKDIATGAAAVVCPGGGFRTLVFDAEGKEAAKFLNSIGVAAFVLKYRLFREENSPYKEENAKQDIFRAMRLVRSVAKDFNIDTSRIGVMGFSAGGEMAGSRGHGHAQNGFTASRILFSQPRSTWSLMSPRPVNSTRASAISDESMELSGWMSAGRSTPEM